MSLHAPHTRRSFLKASLAAAAAGCALRGSLPAFAEESGMTYGVQLFMLRRQAETDLAGVFREILDLYWLTQGGQDPAAILREHAGRVRLIHMKDRTPNAPTTYNMDKESEHFTELGRGSIPWPALLHQAYAEGVRYAFLDQDETSGPVPASMATSRAYLRTIHI